MLLNGTITTEFISIYNFASLYALLKRYIDDKLLSKNHDKKHSQVSFLHIKVTLPYIIDNPLLSIMDCHLPYLGTRGAHLKNKLH